MTEEKTVVPLVVQLVNQEVGLRDYFAAAALQGLLACPTAEGTRESLARSSYEWADAMLAERAKK